MDKASPVAGAPSGHSNPAVVRIEGVTKRFGALTAVDGLTLDIGQGEFFALLGPSGCGKTTLLRMLAGFDRPDSGRIWLDGADVSDVPPHRRPVNMMFQSYALFPHLSAAGNIAFGLKRAGMPRDSIAARVADLLRLVRLEGYGDRRPDQLSGGQRQRVALARALARQPRLLLLDEPMAALDRKLREETQFELKQIQRSLGLTFVVVTHDQQEAMALADRIAVMERGRLAQVDTPVAIYNRPASRYVASFIGDINILECIVESVSKDSAALRLKPGGGRILWTLPESESEREGLDSILQPGREIAMCYRPERLSMTPSDEADAGEQTAPGGLRGSLVGSAFLGDQIAYRVALDGGGQLRIARPNRAGAAARSFEIGAPVRVSIPADAGVLLKG